MSLRALLVEDNTSIRSVVATHLRDADFEVAEAGVAHDAMALAGKEAFDVAILDIALPDGSGLDVCRRLRSQTHYTPVIMLTARDGESDRVLGLEVGADDYVTKPFSVAELVARARAQVRRSSAQSEQSENLEVIDCGDVSIDTRSREVMVRGKGVKLTALEFDLLTWLASHPGRVFSRTQLLDSVWGHGYDGFEHTVNSNINRLRGKIERDPGKPDFIKTVWGVGYCFKSG